MEYSLTFGHGFASLLYAVLILILMEYSLTRKVAG